MSCQHNIWKNETNVRASVRCRNRNELRGMTNLDLCWVYLAAISYNIVPTSRDLKTRRIGSTRKCHEFYISTREKNLSARKQQQCKMKRYFNMPFPSTICNSRHKNVQCTWQTWIYLRGLVENGWQFQMSTKYHLYDEASMF